MIYSAMLNGADENADPFTRVHFFTLECEISSTVLYDIKRNNASFHTKSSVVYYSGIK
jgi:hypothetical protein